MDKPRLRNALDLLFDEFARAPVLGSLIAPDESVYKPDPEELEAALKEAMAKEASDALAEASVAARGVAAAAAMLGQKYQLVITNVPYLARGKHTDSLKDFCEANYTASKNDIATVFLERGLKLCVKGGACALVMPQNWLFLTSYKKLCEKLLKNETWDLLARLGAKAFQTPMWDFNVQLFIISNLKPPQDNPLTGETARPHLLAGLDVSDKASAQDKAEALPKAKLETGEQAAMLENPDARVAFGEIGGELREKYTDSSKGITTGDDDRFKRRFWEFDIKPTTFVYQQTTSYFSTHFNGLDRVIEFDDKNGHIFLPPEIRRIQLHNADKRGNRACNKLGVGISEIRTLPATFYIGNKFDTNIAVIIPLDEKNLPAIWCFCSSRNITRLCARSTRA